MKRIWLIILGLLVLATIVVWAAILTSGDDKLQLVACDVGQGDAMLATWKSYQILIDGGPDNSVLTCLGKYMPFWDREIEVVVNTHPQLDHYGGLVEVVRRYQVDTFVVDGLDSSNQGWIALEKEVGGRGIRVVKAIKGMTISTGLIRLEVVNPVPELIADREPTSKPNVLGTFTVKEDPNAFSIVATLSFGDFDALLTGDIDPATIDKILATGKIRDVEYLKVPHHGSKNGLTKQLLDASQPEAAVISVGRKNRYGHPHAETLKMLEDAGVKIYRTDEVEDVVLITDGKSWYVNSKDIQ